MGQPPAPSGTPRTEIGPHEEDRSMTGPGITALWEGLRDAGLPEVMLYLPEGSACRCHWDDTAVLGGARVALPGDQDRNIVRIIPIESCVGIGIPSPKGVDPIGYRSTIREKLLDGLAPTAPAPPPSWADSPQTIIEEDASAWIRP
jgi:hypothetical protein